MAPLISVIIPCYNHAHFLGEAIGSVLAQTYPYFEIIVVDDGSTDNSAEVASRYAQVKYIRQNNQGLSAARNTGLGESQGHYLIFLDADDRLLPHALEVGLSCMQAYPEIAFASGHYHYIKENGAFLFEPEQNYVECDHYLALLQGNYVAMHAAVIFRRTVFEVIGPYDTALPVSEDYDLYLRIARRFPVFCHDEVVAEYRQHGQNMSHNYTLMLTTALQVLRSQWPYVRQEQQAVKFFKAGLKNWQTYYGDCMIAQASELWLAGRRKEALQKRVTLWRYAPNYALQHRLDQLAKSRLSSLVARFASSSPQTSDELPPPPAVGQVHFGDLRRLKPVKANIDQAFSASIDGYYVEQFLRRQRHYIRGQVLEIGDTNYAPTWGGDRVIGHDRLQINEDQPHDLSSLDHFDPNTYDCIIFVHGLHRLYDLQSAMQILHRHLKIGGVLLITAPGIGQIGATDRNKPGLWAFTGEAVWQLFTSIFSWRYVKLGAYGNVLTTIASLYGLAATDLSDEERGAGDFCYQQLITARAIKTEVSTIR